METVESKLIETIKSESKKHEDSDKTKSLINALAEFESLVKKGLTVKRGNNLMSVEDALLSRASFNKK